MRSPHWGINVNVQITEFNARIKYNPVPKTVSREQNKAIRSHISCIETKAKTKLSKTLTEEISRLISLGHGKICFRVCQITFVFIFATFVI